MVVEGKGEEEEVKKKGQLWMGSRLS